MDRSWRHHLELFDPGDVGRAMLEVGERLEHSVDRGGDLVGNGHSCHSFPPLSERRAWPIRTAISSPPQESSTALSFQRFPPTTREWNGKLSGRPREIPRAGEPTAQAGSTAPARSSRLLAACPPRKPARSREYDSPARRVREARWLRRRRPAAPHQTPRPSCSPPR